MKHGKPSHKPTDLSLGFHMVMVAKSPPLVETMGISRSNHCTGCGKQITGTRTKNFLLAKKQLLYFV